MISSCPLHATFDELSTMLFLFPENVHVHPADRHQGAESYRLDDPEASRGCFLNEVLVIDFVITP